MKKIWSETACNDSISLILQFKSQSKEYEMKIREGRPEDSKFLATVVAEAIGTELCIGLAGGETRLPLVNELFTSLAADPESQYSFRNSFVATTDDGVPIGGIIAYDGADLRRLRKAFAREANKILGWNVTEEESEKWEDEADPGEIYIDSLYVAPEYRKRGVASALLKGVEARFRETQKPLGLLVEPENHKALNTYIHWGFKQVGISHFFQTPMLHLQKDSSLVD